MQNLLCRLIYLGKYIKFNIKRAKMKITVQTN